jgi:hypothetical protein
VAFVLLTFARPARAAHLHTQPAFCFQQVTAKQFASFSHRVWKLSRWRRGAPKASTIAAYHHKLSCAAGPRNRQAMQERWHREQDAYFAHRHHERYCRSGTVVRGRVSYFGGGLMASGHYTSEPAIALNLDAGTEAGWNNATTRSWLSKLQRFRVTIASHSAVLFVGDLGPAASTYRAVDVSEGGVAALGLTGAFPTDAIGTARLIPPGCI